MVEGKNRGVITDNNYRESVAEATEKLIVRNIDEWRSLSLEQNNGTEVRSARILKAFLKPKKLSAEELTIKYGLTNEEIRKLDLF